MIRFNREVDIREAMVIEELLQSPLSELAYWALVERGLRWRLLPLSEPQARQHEGS